MLLFLSSNKVKLVPDTTSIEIDRPDILEVTLSESLTPRSSRLFRSMLAGATGAMLSCVMNKLFDGKALTLPAASTSLQTNAVCALALSGVISCTSM